MIAPLEEGITMNYANRILQFLKARLQHSLAVQYCMGDTSTSKQTYKNFLLCVKLRFLVKFVVRLLAYVIFIVQRQQLCNKAHKIQDFTIKET